MIPKVERLCKRATQDLSHAIEAVSQPQPLVHEKRDNGSQVVDADLKRDPALGFLSGFDPYFSDPSNVRAPPAHPRKRTHKGADGVEVQSFSLSGRCQSMLKGSTVFPSRAS